MGRAVPPGDWEKYARYRAKGWTRAAAARKVGVSYRAAIDRDKKIAGDHRSPAARAAALAEQSPAVTALDDLKPEAKRALEDFGYFQRRYFGRIAVPWQEESANRVVQFLETPQEEYVVINVAPGSGKSTTFCLDIAAWATCRNRAIRGLIGSKTQTQARWYVGRLRRAFESTTPIQAKVHELRLGLALDAEATLAEDFGTFKSERPGYSWTNDAFTVAQPDDRNTGEKESTWQGFGMDSGFLGGRFDLVLWDDVVDFKTVKTVESRENQRAWWDDIAETRLDPGGVLVLQGQRLGAEDLYRYALDKKSLADDDDEGFDPDAQHLSGKKYHHIVFKAHDEEKCEGKHGFDAPYWPEGCLLDPRRLHWPKLRGLMENQEKYRVLYQQEDVDPADILVDPLWVWGGTNPRTGEHFPGCIDADRGFCEIPQGLTGSLLSVATADPSPTMYWSVQWWGVQVVDGQPEQRFLLDLVRRKMDAADFLDWSHTRNCFTGVMEEWQARSVDLGLPIRHWIVESNAAQRFLLQYDHVRRWQAKWSVDLIPHQTQRNKSDPEFGVQTLAPHYRYGRIRLPLKRNTECQFTTRKIIDEVTRWPEGATDDCVMAQWFLEWHLPNLIPPVGGLKRAWRPSWLRKSDTYGRRELATA